MRYEKGNAVIAVETFDGFGKHPGLWIGSKNPNTLCKVASFGSDDKAQTFCKWFDYFVNLKGKEPKEDKADV